MATRTGESLARAQVASPPTCGAFWRFVEREYLIDDDLFADLLPPHRPIREQARSTEEDMKPHPLLTKLVRTRPSLPLSNPVRGREARARKTEPTTGANFAPGDPSTLR